VNGYQKFTELGNAICATNPDDFRGMKTLAAELGMPIMLFPDWQSSWEKERKLFTNYRNYLTHQGGMFRVVRAGEVLILSRAAYKSRKVYTWSQADRDYDADPSQWVTVQSACAGVIQDTIAFLDLGYERIRQRLDPQLVNPTYQRLWGWKPGVDPLTPPSPPSPAAHAASTNVGSNLTVSLTGSTACKVDDRPSQDTGNGPGPSGQRVV
jgi:hypothetical protein